MSEFGGERGKRAHETKSELVEKMEEMPHETESEFVEKMEEMPHETESEFGESRGKALHEIMSEFVGLREASSPTLPARSPSDSRGEGGATFLAAAKKALSREEKNPTHSRRIFLYRTRFGRFLFSVRQSSKTILRVSTVRRSSSRFSRQVSSFFLAVSLSTSVLRSSSFSWAMLRRTDLPKESTVRRGLALWAGFALSLIHI